MKKEQLYKLKYSTNYVLFWPSCTGKVRNMVDERKK